MNLLPEHIRKPVRRVYVILRNIAIGLIVTVFVLISIWGVIALIYDIQD